MPVPPTLAALEIWREEILVASKWLNRYPRLVRLGNRWEGHEPVEMAVGPDGCDLLLDVRANIGGEWSVGLRANGVVNLIRACHVDFHGLPGGHGLDFRELTGSGSGHEDDASLQGFDVHQAIRAFCRRVTIQLPTTSELEMFDDDL